MNVDSCSATALFLIAGVVLMSGYMIDMTLRDIAKAIRGKL